MATAIDQRLPGAELIARGLDDLAEGRTSQEAMLVAAAATRLRTIGIPVPGTTVEAPLHRLYELVSAEDPDGAHSRYNALIARVASFARAAGRRASSS